MVMGFLERQASGTVSGQYRVTGCAIRGAESMTFIIYTVLMKCSGLLTLARRIPMTHLSSDA